MDTLQQVDTTCVEIAEIDLVMAKLNRTNNPLVESRGD